MRIIKRTTLQTYWIHHAETERPLSEWVRVVRAAKWSSMQDVKAQFPKASIIDSKRVVFDIHGGNYRLIAEINFHIQAVFVRFIGTHKQYDKIDAATIKQH